MCVCVVDNRGTAMPGVPVELSAVAEVDRGLRQAQTSATGAVTFAEVSLGAHHVTASWRDRSVRGQVVVRPDSDATITLRFVDSAECTRTTMVVVSDEQGQPAINCRVAVVGFGQGDVGPRRVLTPLTARTDERGVAWFKGIAFEWALFAVTEASREFRCHWRGPGAGAHVRADIRPSATGLLLAYVRTADGLPAIAQPIEIHAVGSQATDGFSDLVRTVHTDQRGAVEVSLDPGAYYLATPANDPRIVRRGPQRLHDGEQIPDTVDLSVVHVPSNGNVRVELELAHGGKLVGSVGVAVGQAVPDAEVRICQMALPPLPQGLGDVRVRPPVDDWAEIECGLDLSRSGRLRGGRFVIDGLRPGLWLLRVVHPEFAVDETLVRVSDADTQISLWGGRRAELRGLATPGARVSLSRASGGPRSCAVEVGADGYFQCAALPCGEYLVTVDGYDGTMPLSLAAGESGFVDLRALAAPRGVLTGRVIGVPRGTDLRVTMSGSAADMEGDAFTFRFPAPFVGRVNVIASFARPGATHEWEISMPPCDVPTARHEADAVLGSCAAVIRTRDPAAESAIVTVMSRALEVPWDETWQLHLESRFDRDGLIELDLLHPGTYEARAVWADGREASREFTVPTTEAIELRSDARTTLRVCVRDATGRPMPGVGVILCRDPEGRGASRIDALLGHAESEGRTALTDGEGVVSLAARWPGRCVVGCGPVLEGGCLGEVSSFEVLEPGRDNERVINLVMRSSELTGERR